MDGEWQACNGPQPGAPELEATVRDFSSSHDDFEPYPFSMVETGIVEERLGADRKPVYSNNPNLLTTTGQENFDQWFRDVEGVNISTTIALPLAEVAGTSGVYGYDDQDFFPIDGRLLGNEGFEHNYHFTLELHTRFIYGGGEVFEFVGDDDVWVFINDKLVIDLGGVHETASDLVNLDGEASGLELTVGESYPLDFFFAERHTIGSTFRIETTISEFDFCE